jgi:hypothetical protein
VRPSGKGDGLILCQTAVYVNGNTIEIAEWRHRADLAVREHSSEVALTGEPEFMDAKCFFRFRVIHDAIGGKHKHDQLFICKRHHSFCHELSGDVFCRCDLQRGIRGVVLLHFIRDLMFTEQRFQFFRAGHTAPAFQV